MHKSIVFEPQIRKEVLLALKPLICGNMILCQRVFIRLLQKLHYKKQMFGRSLSLGLAASLYLGYDRNPKCCGIFGVSSKTSTVDYSQNSKKVSSTVNNLLCNGIELLKNRGYDSAGIVSYTQTPKGLVSLIQKRAERKGGLNCIDQVNKIVSEKMKDCTLGMGHTRWATCGEKVDKNAHPHGSQDQEIYIVHNGIIGNHAEIKTEYLSDYTFKSQTDTEVVVHLLRKMTSQGKTMTQALKNLQNYFTKTSQWGLVVMHKQTPDTIYTSTRGSPILVGFSASEEQVYVASEVIAFSRLVDCYFVTDDDEVWELNPDAISTIKKDLQAKGRLKKINKDQIVHRVPPEGFKTFFSHEMRQQGNLKYVPDFQRVKSIEYGDFLTIIACGSSSYASLAAQQIFRKLKCFRKIHIFDPVQVTEDDITQDDTVIVVSQSGETKDIIGTIKQCRSKPTVKIIGIINVEDSTISRKVDFPIYIKVGREVSVAATKSCFYQILYLMELATLIAQSKKSAPMALIEEIRGNINQIGEFTRKTFEQTQQKCLQLAAILKQKQSLFILARKEGMAIAKEAALKLKQLNYIHAQALGACQMKHGPIALINSQQKLSTVVILIILNDDTYEQLMNALDQMYSRNAYVIVITDCKEKIEKVHTSQLQKNPDAQRKYHFMIDVPHLKHLSHLLTLIPFQLLVEKIGELKEINIDFPRNLAKTVSV